MDDNFRDNGVGQASAAYEGHRTIADPVTQLDGGQSSSARKGHVRRAAVSPLGGGLSRRARKGQTSIAPAIPDDASGQLSQAREGHRGVAAGVPQNDSGQIIAAHKGQRALAAVVTPCESGRNAAADKANDPSPSLAPSSDGGHVKGAREGLENHAPVASTIVADGQKLIARDGHTIYATSDDPLGESGPCRRALDGHMTDAALSDTIAEIREQWRRRQAWHRAEKSLTLQAKALCRRLVGGDKDEAGKLYNAAIGKAKHDLAEFAFGAIFPLTAAKDGIEGQRKNVEKRLAKLAKGLPVAPFVLATPGVSLNTLAGIIGEAGDLSVYSTHSKLWKRMGLAVMPDGGRQRRVSGDAALEHGYSPSRRSVAWNLGSGLIGCMGHGPRPIVGENVSAREDLSHYQKMFLARCRYEVERDPTMARKPAKNKETGEERESYSAHASARAKRYVEKKFLRALWREWNRQSD